MMRLCVQGLRGWSPDFSGDLASAWGPNFHIQTGAKYLLEKLGANQARRMSELTKVGVDVALSLTELVSPDHIIFSSRHGEIKSSADLLAMIGRKEVLSPTLFSQSVHNTSIGTYTLIKKSNAATTAVGGGPNSFMMGLVSCWLYLQENPGKVVLYLSSDEAVPEMFVDHLEEANRPLTLALLVSGDGSGIPIEISKTEHQRTENVSKTETQSFQFLQWASSGHMMGQLLGGDSAWDLKKC